VDARAANERIAEKAKRLQFVSRVPMLCECDAPDCRAVVMITLDEYHELRRDPDSFLTAADHPIEGAQPRRETSTYAIQRTTRESRNADGQHHHRCSA
jgi:hypothetical protein